MWGPLVRSERHGQHQESVNQQEQAGLVETGMRGRLVVTLGDERGTMMRLDNVTVQSGNGASLVMPRVCVCAAGSTAPAQPGVVATCAECGGTRAQAPEAPRPERPSRRKLQDFLGGFV